MFRKNVFPLLVLPYCIPDYCNLTMSYYDSLVTLKLFILYIYQTYSISPLYHKSHMIFFLQMNALNISDSNH